MNYKFTRNTIITGLLAVGVGLWGGNASQLNATVNTVSGSTDGGSISGEFETTGFNNPTYINLPQLSYSYGSLTPLVAEDLIFTITDLDGFSGLEVEVRLFYDVDHTANINQVSKNVAGMPTIEYQGNATLQSAYDAHTTTLNDGDAFILREKTVATSSDYFEVVYGGSPGTLTELDVSWRLNSSSYTQGYSIYERNFVIDFTPSKVAKYSNLEGKWTAGVRVLDTNNADAVVAESFLTTINMAWYGEIVVPNGIEVDFNGAGLVTIDTDYASNTEVIEDVLFISNGSFDQLIGADSSWESDKVDPNNLGNYYATLATGSSDLSFSQVFHMVVDDSEILTNHANATTVSANNVPGPGFVGYATTIAATHGGTSEEGVLLDYYLYIKTSANFQNATYTGFIYLGIQNSII
jgi:hypothetical protein